MGRCAGDSNAHCQHCWYPALEERTILFLWIYLWIPKHLQKHGLEHGLAEFVRCPSQVAQTVGAPQQGRNPLLLGQRGKGDSSVQNIFI